jgi:hypothetical protein
MRRSYVVRLSIEPLAEGRFVGEVEDVETGRRCRISSAEDLLRFVTATARPSVAATSPAAHTGETLEPTL